MATESRNMPLPRPLAEKSQVAWGLSPMGPRGKEDRWAEMASPWQVLSAHSFLPPKASPQVTGAVGTDSTRRPSEEATNSQGLISRQIPTCPLGSWREFSLQPGRGISSKIPIPHGRIFSLDVSQGGQGWGGGGQMLAKCRRSQQQDGRLNKADRQQWEWNPLIKSPIHRFPSAYLAILSFIYLFFPNFKLFILYWGIAD